MNKIRLPSIYEMLFVLAVSLKPFYSGASGTLQISDMIYAVLFILYIIHGRISFPSKQEIQWAKVFILIIGYQFCVNTVNFIIYVLQGMVDYRFIRFNLFYIFNFMVCITVFQLYANIGYKRLFKLYILGTLLSIGVCYLGVLLNFRGLGRERGFFNNPNQLGYFSILVMSIFVIYSRQIKKGIRLIAIILCLILNILSLSKASLIGSAILLIVYAVISSDERGIKKTISIIALVSLVTMTLYLLMFSDAGLLTRNYYIRTMRRRLLMMQYENDSDLGTGRGYDRIKEIGVFLITGVGEGAFTRFNAAYGKELHSMYGSIIVCYGLIGFAGYVFLFKKALCSNKTTLYSLLSFSGILIYCVTHNGVRNTLLWTLVAMLLLRPYEESKLKEV